MLKSLKHKLLKNKKGIITGYAILIALMSIVTIAAIKPFGEAVNNVFDNVGNAILPTTTPAPSPVAPLPEIVSFSADSSILDASNTGTNLQWSTANAVSCTGSNGSTGWAGNRDLTGPFATGSLSSTTTYTLTCFNSENQSVSRDVTIEVTKPVVITDNFSSGPDALYSIFDGSNSTKISDTNFLIVHAENVSTSIYNINTNEFTDGPNASTSSFGLGSHSIKNPDGTFLILRGAGTQTTYIYNPILNSFSNGPDMTASSKGGSHSILRSDGKFLIVHGNSGINTTIYDPVNNTMTAGPNLSSYSSNIGSHSIPRPDGTFLIVHGNSKSETSIYDPVSNTMTAGPTLTSAAGSGSHSIQRPDGTFLIIIGNGSTDTNIYDPVSNTMTAGSSLLTAISSGSHTFSLPNGKFLIFHGGGLKTTTIYSPTVSQ